MHFYAIVLAAMSAGALSVSLIQKDPLNSKGLPNVSCEGKDAGESALEPHPSKSFSNIGLQDMLREDLALGQCLAI